MKFSWYPLHGKVWIMFGCVTLIATMVVIDGLLQGDILRMLAGVAVAVPFWTFLIKGIPIPQKVARSVSAQVDRAMSLQPGANTPSFRWIMVVLGVVIGASTIAGAYAILFAEPENIELFVPILGREIRRAETEELGRLVRIGYAAIFLGAAWGFLITAWVRAKD